MLQNGSSPADSLFAEEHKEGTKAVKVSQTCTYHPGVCDARGKIGVQHGYFSADPLPHFGFFRLLVRAPNRESAALQVCTSACLYVCMSVRLHVCM